MKTALPALLAAGALLMGAQRGLVGSYAYPWPSLQELIVSPQTTQDVSFVVAGFRRVAADVAWVELLQYVGDDQGFEEHWHVHAHGRELESQRFEKNRLRDMSLRVARLDPYFRDVYLFGAGILAWSPVIDRPDEALEVLREGLIRNPSYWPIQNYIGAIFYKKNSRDEPMLRLLEDTVRQPDAPTVTKSVLANYYKSQKRYADAIRIWEIILSNPNDRWYHDHARRQIAHLLSLEHSN